jgi:predicted nucleic acid-binding protein
MALSEVAQLPEMIPRICRDPGDDQVIACAVVGKADVIVSGDDDLLALEQAGGMPILTAAQFLELLEQGNRRQYERKYKPESHRHLESADAGRDRRFLG